MRPSQCRVVLTGATGGIGAACASHLLEEGAAVMLVGRSPARLSALARSLAHESIDCHRLAWHPADLSDPASIAPLADAAAQWRCDVLVQAAGVPGFGPIESIAPDEMARILRLNLLMPMQLTQALLPHLRRQSEARLVFVGSALGGIGLPGYCVYAASKFGLRGFAEALRRELGDTGVRVQYLGPRGTRTSFNSDAAEQYQRATGAALDDVETVADALLRLLASGAAERFVGFPEKLAVRLNGLAPALLDGAFAPHRRSLAASASTPLAGPAAGCADPDGPPSADRGA